MNTVHAKNNRYKNGWYNPSYSNQIAKEKAESIEPSLKQVKYRDDLYKFCLQKGIVREGFRLGRTKQTIRSNIAAFQTIIRKNGLVDEFMNAKPVKENDNEVD